ncbi:MAG: glycosyltransferase [Candidatus Hodarchaeota archaeon]
MIEVSIIIPTKNGGVNLKACLEAVYNQNYIGEIEIIIVDSGSIDDTLSIAKHYTDRIIEINPKDFSHGYSRNLGASMSRGEYLVFCNQDVIPANAYWLSNLLEPLKEESIAASYSRQIPPLGTQCFEKIFLERHYTSTNVIHTYEGLKKRGPQEVILFSTVSGALRRIIWKKFQFDENIVMSEDQEIAFRLLKSKWQIAYQADSIVYHSNRYSFLSAFRRYFDSGWSMAYYPEYRILSPSKGVSYLKSSCVDLLSDERYSLVERLRSMMYLFAKVFGFVLGQTAPYMPIGIRDKISYTRSLLRDVIH